MSDSIDRDTALRLLDGLEAGTLPTADAGFLVEELDPVLVHVIVKYLRESYPASNPAAHAVLERVVALTSSCPAAVSKSKQGESDPVSEWFEAEYGFSEYHGRGRELVALIVDKLDS
ncbi:MAG: hypothetical protein GY716_01405 [bacterium]|nr:hypothetical protein [bacterium]